MILGIDYGKLSLRDALDLAILIEEEACERYQELTSQMTLHHTPEAAKFFAFMARNEEKHRQALAARRQELFGQAPAKVTRAQLFDVEAPEYDEVRASMTAREALHTALRAEKKAYEFFNASLQRIGDSSVRTLFEELRGEEVEHQKLVLAELDRTPPDPALKAELFEDEPVAH